MSSNPSAPWHRGGRPRRHVESARCPCQPQVLRAGRHRVISHRLLGPELEIPGVDEHLEHLERTAAGR